MKTTFSVLILLLFSTLSVAQTARDYSVAVTVDNTSIKDSVILHWPHDDRATTYIVSKRTDPTATWKELDFLDKVDLDTVALSSRTEFRITKFYLINSIQQTAFGYVLTDKPFTIPASSGTVILLVSSELLPAIEPDVTQWISDVRAEGWRVVRHSIERAMTPPQVKGLIKTDYANDNRVRSVFIVGQVAVPYSGDIAPDEHFPGQGNHQGAWPADVYYASVTTSADWGDASVNDATADSAWNKNIPGDGKFDPSVFDVDTKLEVGRVELSRLPWYPESEVELIKRYFRKDHAFRTGTLTAPNRALISDKFGVLDAKDVPSTTGWASFPALMSSDSIHETDTWLPTLAKDSYLWTYACGGGTWNAAAGIGGTQNFGETPPKAIFMMLFGSFFGDWDHYDNLLRMPLGNEWTLTNAWAGRPIMMFHSMGLGQTIGYSTALSQNYNRYPETKYTHSIHLSLLGDPTLRMVYRKPAQDLQFTKTGSTYHFTWKETNDSSIAGYMLFHASEKTGDYLPAFPQPVTGTTLDYTPAQEQDSLFILRTVYAVPSPSGLYYGLSVGAYPSSSSSSVLSSRDLRDQLRYADGVVKVNVLPGEPRTLWVGDILGRTILERTVSNGASTIDLPPTAHGMLFARLSSGAQLKFSR